MARFTQEEHLLELTPPSILLCLKKEPEGSDDSTNAVELVMRVKTALTAVSVDILISLLPM